MKLSDIKIGQFVIPIPSVQIFLERRSRNYPELRNLTCYEIIAVTSANVLVQHYAFAPHEIAEIGTKETHPEYWL